MPSMGRSQLPNYSIVLISIKTRRKEQKKETAKNKEKRKNTILLKHIRYPSIPIIQTENTIDVAQTLGKSQSSGWCCSVLFFFQFLFLLDSCLVAGALERNGWQCLYSLSLSLALFCFFSVLVVLFSCFSSSFPFFVLVMYDRSYKHNYKNNK